ncbi:hypothetical protein SteCoe_28001 [Stentor coeruleus]|uniref:RING-type domain-containing protein n=1 Tax=Stentor coeruleus TaxID=5963 RepID=A0A1R2B977_9CILI|nr:hypothetical protein SteCoe_28001 [Stentor coeruleus]
MAEVPNRESVDSIIPLCSQIPSIKSSVHIKANSFKYLDYGLQFMCSALMPTEILVRFFVYEDGLGFIKDPKYDIPDQKFNIQIGFDQILDVRVNFNDFSYEYSTSLPIVIEAANENLIEVTLIEVRGKNLRILQQRVIKNNQMFELREIFNPPNDDMDERERFCVVCMSYARNTIIEPCCHVCLCERCANLMRTQVNRKCPMCRQEVTSFIKINFK